MGKKKRRQTTYLEELAFENLAKWAGLLRVAQEYAQRQEQGPEVSVWDPEVRLVHDGMHAVSELDSLRSDLRRILTLLDDMSESVSSVLNYYAKWKASVAGADQQKNP